DTRVLGGRRPVASVRRPCAHAAGGGPVPPMSARSACLALLVAAALAAPGREASAGAWSLARGEYYTELSGSQYVTQTTYDGEGDRIPFPSPWKLQHLGGSWRTQLGWRKSLNLLFSVTGISVAGFEGPAALVPTETGLSVFELALHYRLANGDRALALEGLWQAPAGYDRGLSRGLGDGRQQFSALLHGGSVLGSRAYFEASGGASYRFHKLGSPDDAANADPRKTTNVYADFGAEAGFWVGQGGGNRRPLPGRILGSTTGVGDAGNVHYVGPMVITGDDQLDQSVHLAGPMLLYRLDERIDVLAGSYSTAAGKNTLHFDQVYIAFAFKHSQLK